jgi:hypothetical protein
LQHIANNLPDAFNDYKHATKSSNHVVNMPERVKVSKKTIQTSQVQKWGRTTTKKDNTTSKHPRKERKRPDKKAVNASQTYG